MTKQQLTKKIIAQLRKNGLLNEAKVKQHLKESKKLLLERSDRVTGTTEGKTPEEAIKKAWILLKKDTGSYKDLLPYDYATDDSPQEDEDGNELWPEDNPDSRHNTDIDYFANLQVYNIESESGVIIWCCDYQILDRGYMR